MKVSSRALLAIASAVIAMALVPALAYAGSAQPQGSNLAAGALGTTTATYEGEGTLNLIQSGDYHPEADGAAGRYSKRSSSSLNSAQEAAFRSRLTMCLASRQESVDMSDLGIVASDKDSLGTAISPIMSDIINSNPDFFYVSNSYGYTFYNLGEGGTLMLAKVSPRYAYDSSVIDTMVSSYEQSMQVVLSWVPQNVTKVQQVKAVHDWFGYNCSYNDDAADAGANSYINRNPWNAYGALVDHRPVCQGYSLAFIAVMNRLGIPCTFVTQDAVYPDKAGHGWNRIELDGKWYNLDVTWDEPSSNQGAPYTTYFLKSDQWFINDSIAHNLKYHTEWTPRGIAGTDTTYDDDAAQNWPMYSGPASVGLSVTDFALPASATLAANGSQLLSITSIAPAGIDVDLARARARWSSSNPSVAYVNSAGKVFSGDASGTAVITCVIDGVSKTCAVTVTDPIELAPGEIGGKVDACKWILSSDHKTLTVSPFIGIEGTFYGSPDAWDGYTNEITTVVFTDTIHAIGPLSSMFYGYTSLETVDLSGLDTSDVTSMHTMFYNCESLTSIDVSGFKTANVTDMQWMFGHCKSLLTLDASKFDTSSVTDMNHMFYNCQKLGFLDISSFDTSSLVAHGFDGFIENCSKLSEFRVGQGYTTSAAGDFFFPAPTSDTGMWWSSVDGWWYFVDDIIAGRKGVADIYANACPVVHDHDFGSWAINAQPTCVTNGSRQRICSVCGYTQKEDIAAAGHVWGPGKITKSPTYDATGVRTFTCSKCGAQRTESIPKLARTSIGKAVVSVLSKATYSGKAITPNPTVKIGGKTLVKGVDYTVSYKNNLNVGKSATVVVSGRGAYSGVKSVAFEITKAPNKATPAKRSVKRTLKATSLRKKAIALAFPNVTTSFGTAKWKIAKKDKKKVLSLKGGKVKVKRGAKAGTYFIKLRAVVAGTSNYKAAKTKVVMVRITVK